MKKIHIGIAKKRLSILWLSIFTILFAIVFVQSLLGTFDEKDQNGNLVSRNKELWSWFLPTILPTITMMIAVFVSDAMGIAQKVNFVDRFFFRLTFFLSCLYLFMILITMVTAQWASQWPIETLKSSNLWLGPLQALAAGSLVIFFRLKESKEK
jgi:hypothetical protein